MINPRFLFSASLLALSVAWSGAALADVPPADACSTPSSIGSACNNAGTSADEPGTCQSSMCSHEGPGPDGGFVNTMYPCTLCMAGTGTGGGTTGTGTGTTGTGTGTSSGSGTSGGGSSCALGAVGREGAVTGTLVLLGLTGLLAGRRPRRSRSPRA